MHVYVNTCERHCKLYYLEFSLIEIAKGLKLRLAEEGAGGQLHQKMG